MDGPPGGKAEVDNGVLAVVGAIAVVALTALFFFIRSKAPTPVPAATNEGDTTGWTSPSCLMLVMCDIAVLMDMTHLAISSSSSTLCDK